MKNNKGITLTALVVYIIVLVIVLGIISAILNQFYQNTGQLLSNTDDVLEFNHFNTFFLKEIKATGNKVDNISSNYILFTSGNSFSVQNKKIYYNNIEICKGVESFLVQSGKDGDGKDSDIVHIEITFKNFKKSMNYKVEEIY